MNIQSSQVFPLWAYTKAKKNLVFRATVLKTLGRVGSVIIIFIFLRIETSIIKTSTEKNGIFVKKSLGSAGSDR